MYKNKVESFLNFIQLFFHEKNFSNFLWNLNFLKLIFVNRIFIEENANY